MGVFRHASFPAAPALPQGRDFGPLAAARSFRRRMLLDSQHRPANLAAIDADIAERCRHIAMPGELLGDLKIARGIIDARDGAGANAMQPERSSSIAARRLQHCVPALGDHGFGEGVALAFAPKPALAPSPFQLRLFWHA